MRETESICVRSREVDHALENRSAVGGEENTVFQYNNTTDYEANDLRHAVTTRHSFCSFSQYMICI